MKGVVSALPRLGKRGANPAGSLSTHEAAIILGVSQPTLLKLLKAKLIPEPQRFSGTRYWNSADLNHARVVIQNLQDEGKLRARRANR